MSEALYRYSIIGTGLPYGMEGSTGFGMAHAHYPNFKATGKVDLVAIADIDKSEAEQRLQAAGGFVKRALQG